MQRTDGTVYDMGMGQAECRWSEGEGSRGAGREIS